MFSLGIVKDAMVGRAVPRNIPDRRCWDVSEILLRFPCPWWRVGRGAIACRMPRWESSVYQVRKLGTTVLALMPRWKSSGSRASAWVCWDVPVGEVG
jgi:hypothetical protein